MQRIKKIAIKKMRTRLDIKNKLNKMQRGMKLKKLNFKKD
jgi:hypothetical protein